MGMPAVLAERNKRGNIMKNAMANDHAGTALKKQIKEYLESEGHEVVDFGTYDKGSCDLSDFILPASLSIAKGECERGIFVDGVGYGSAMICEQGKRNLCLRVSGSILCDACTSA